MKKGITIVDAFKSLEDIDDSVVQPVVDKYNRTKLTEAKEHKSKESDNFTIDISGKDMYDRGQAYYYARTGDHVDYMGDKFEIIVDKNGGHRIGYSNTLLLKNLETGEVIEISKQDFIDGAMLLNEEVTMTESIDDYWVLSDGKNPKNSYIYPSIENVDEFIAQLEPGEKYWELLHYVKGEPTKVWSSTEGKIGESLEEDAEEIRRQIAWCKAALNNPYGREASDAKANYGKDWRRRVKDDLQRFEKQLSKGESCELKEEPILEPEYDSRKSFYGKAYVDEKKDGSKVLYSYGTPVCRIKDGKVTLLRKGYLGWASSQTTLRHVKEFLKQNGFKAGSINDLRKNYPVEQAGVNEELTEAMTFNLMDDKEVEEGKEFLEETPEEHVEQIVDVDAETIEELKDSYIGNVILRCPSCKTLIYKKPELLEKDENDVYNVGETCPHCGSADGFELVGQVASLDIKTPEEAPTTGKDTVEVEEHETVEDSVDGDVKETEEEKEVNIRKPKAIATESLKKPMNKLEELDEDSFNTLVNKYLESTYSNIDNFSTTSCKVDDDKLIVEGVIKFKSGKEKKTTFNLTECTLMKRGKVKFVGSNDTFSLNEAKAFSVVGSLVNGKYIAENLAYKYKALNESKEVIGRVKIKK